MTLEEKINHITLRRLSSEFFLQSSLQFTDFKKSTYQLFNKLYNINIKSILDLKTR